MLLDGVRVLDLSRLLPGGYCTQLLQRQGAQVIKIEAPAGDPLRAMPGGEALYAALHQGKQQLVIDFRTAEGRSALEQQLHDADVLVEGFRPGRMEGFRVGYDRLTAINSSLVYCAITGYGSRGPRAQRAGHDLNYLALSGALSLMPRHAGLPVIPGLQVADMAGGMEAAFLIASALTARSQTGRGARVEVSMMDLMRDWTGPARAAREAGLPGLGLSGEVPCYHVYRVTDGCLSVAALEPKFWVNFCHTVGRADLISRQFDPSAIPEVAALLEPGSRAEWESRFADRDVCVEPVLSLDESADG